MRGPYIGGPLKVPMINPPYDSTGGAPYQYVIMIIIIIITTIMINYRY